MQFSRSLKSSSNSLPSPNGAYIAKVLPSKLTIRETRSLEITRVISLPSELSASVAWFLWSPSSHRVLVASTDLIRICSTQDAQFSASIANPTSGTAKMTYVCFGSNDDEICVFSDFGLKLTIFNLVTTKSVEINTPKLYNGLVASKGFTYRQGTRNMALLNRSGGKDIVSVHATGGYEVMISWVPDTVDAQGLAWSPDGRFVVVWESPAHGHKLIIYTADGHLYKVWNGPVPLLDEEHDIDLGAGIKLVDWSQNGSYLAVADYSHRVNLLAAPSYSESSNLRHGTSVMPRDSLQIWQEIVIPSQSGGFSREFVKATQTICPPTANKSPVSESNTKTGTTTLTFDKSGTLLATRVEHMPTTVWIWDVTTKILRTVLIMHSPTAKVTWHPTINELLMIRCEGDESRGLVQLWDPSWDAPKIIDFGTQLPDGKIIRKAVVRWLNVDTTSPAIFFSDAHDCILGSLVSEEGDTVPWEDAEALGVDIYGQREESPLNLVPADEKRMIASTIEEEPNWTKLSGDSDFVDDTFRFKKFVEPT